MTNLTRAGARPAAAAALALSLLLGACSFDAENPGAITDAGLTDPAALGALVNGVVGDYDNAFQRSALYAGLVSDELRASGTWTWWHQADRDGVLDLDAPTSDLMNIPHGWWGPLSRARFLAEETEARLAGALDAPEASPLTALVRLYAGMAYRDIGEYFCVAAYDGGPATDRAASLDLAEEKLKSAIAAARAAGVDSTAQMAHLVRARVRLSSGDPVGALQDAQAVQDGFRWVAHFRNAAGEDNNLVFQLNQRAEATVGEPFRATGDPRVPVLDTGTKGADNLTARWDQLKLDRYADMRMGSWQEARLIEAEIRLLGGETAQAVALMDRVRAAAGLAPLGAPGAAEAWDALKQERRHELFLEGARMLDMRRFGEFDAGWDAACAPLPRSETSNNPNLQG